MGRVVMCMLLCFSQIHYSHMVTQKQTRDLGGLGCAKNQRTCVHMRERNVDMARVWVCIILCFIQIQHSHMVTQKHTRYLGVGMHKKSKDLSAHEREDRGHDKGEDVYQWLLCFSQIQYIHMVTQKK